MGKGMAPKKGYNDKLFKANYDGINWGKKDNGNSDKIDYGKNDKTKDNGKKGR